MKRILIYKIVIPNGEYDIWNRVDTNKIVETVDLGYNGQCPNWGNRVWLQGIVSEIYSKDNTYELYDVKMTPDYINANYDIIVLPMANIFGVENISRLNQFAARFAQIKIPTYVIACGVQSDSYAELDNLVSVIKKPASDFIKAIYNTGGEFALRGYYTKEFFNRLGFYSAVVTGCPSMYQNGRNFSMQFDPVSEDDFFPMFNGEMRGVAKFMKKYSKSGYIDQERYFDLLFRPQKWNDFKSLLNLVLRYGYDAVSFAAQGRIMQFPDCIDWHNFMIAKGYTYSFGSRIHGNIMPILSGIPATVWAIDSRTLEMAEFFDIPYITNINKVDDLYKLYLKADYSKFNHNYAAHFSDFEAFLKKFGIIDSINDENIFWTQTSDEKALQGTAYLDAAKELERYKYLFQINWFAFRLKNKVKKCYQSIKNNKGKVQ